MTSNYKTTKYSGISSLYFHKLITEIIKIYDLDKKDCKILDYGCGEKVLSKKINCLNYDIDPAYNEVEDLSNVEFDIVVINHVLMYISKENIENLFKFFYKKNKDLKFIFGLGTNNFFINTIAKIIYNKNAYRGTKISYQNQIYLIKKYFNIIKEKKVWGATHICLAKFK